MMARERESLDEEAVSVGEAVRIAVARAPEGLRIPRGLYGPLVWVAEGAAPEVAKRWGLPASEENIEDATAALMDWLLAVLFGTDREQFDEWKSKPPSHSI